MDTYSILSVRISLVSSANVISVIEDLLRKKKQIQIVTPNPEQIIQAQENLEFKKVLNKADLAIPDGIGILWALKILKLVSKSYQLERVTGVDLMLKLCSWADEKGLKIGLLGGRNGVAAKTAQILSQKYQKASFVVLPNLNDIKVTDEKKDKQIIQQIKQVEIQILFLAFGAPFQELWLSKNLKQLPTLKIGMGVGGAFDYISGKIKRAPVWCQKFGLEWLYRLIRQPWRWRRQLRLLKFIFLILRGN